MAYVVFSTAAVLAILAVLCAIVFAIMRRWRWLGWAIIGLALLFVSGIVAAGFATADKRPLATVENTPMSRTRARPSRQPRPNRTSTLVPKPSPTPDAPLTITSIAQKTDTEALQKFRKNWTEIVRSSATAIKAHDTAAEYLREGNVVDASGQLKACQETAGGIVRDSYRLPVDPENDVDSKLLSAIEKIGDGLGYGCKSARSYLDTNAPSDAADAKGHFADVTEGIFQSELLARTKYESLGGNADSLLKFSTALR